MADGLSLILQNFGLEYIAQKNEIDTKTFYLPIHMTKMVALTRLVTKLFWESDNNHPCWMRIRLKTAQDNT